MYKHAKSKSWLRERSRRISKAGEPKRRKRMAGPVAQATNVGLVMLRKRRALAAKGGDDHENVWEGGVAEYALGTDC